MKLRDNISMQLNAYAHLSREYGSYRRIVYSYFSLKSAIAVDVIVLTPTGMAVSASGLNVGE